LSVARSRFLSKRPSNLNFLLEKRYQWMNKYFANKSSIYEVGCGAGFSKVFIDNKNLKLTDVKLQDWVDLEVDALNMPFKDNSVGAILASHMIHHLATPYVFFKEVNRVLEPGGMLIIHDINTSFLMRLMLRVMRHEGYSYDVDVFSKNTIANRPEDPWSANCAIPELLFEDEDKFEFAFPNFKIIRNRKCEGFIFPLSGGVIAKTFTINLPKFMLKLIAAFDAFSISLLPKIFANGREVVLQKR
jgi:SAM-dependent methyltransferase